MQLSITDLVTFIYRQAQIANDPLFGNLQDKTTATEQRPKGKPADFKILKSTKQKGSSFATAVTPAGEEKTQYCPSKGSSSAKSISAFQKPCLYCQKDHALDSCRNLKEQPPKDRIEFLKFKGLCFGCLTQGHLSKDCKKGMTCQECTQRHPGILHVQKDSVISKKD